MKLVPLGSLVKIKTGKLDANASSPNGIYPFFTCSTKTLRIDSYSYDCECVLVAGNGDLNVKYYNGKFDAYQRTYIIESLDKNVLNIKYLYFFMEKYIEILRTQTIGGVIKYIKLGNLTNAKIPLIDIEVQEKIVKVLEKSKMLLNKRQSQIEALDELTQNVFLEMFGDPITNNKSLPIITFSEILKEVRYGTSTPPIFVERGNKFIRATNIKKGKIVEKDMLFIDDSEAERIKKCKLDLYEIIFVRSGANSGDNALVTEKYIGEIGGYDIIVNIDTDMVNPYYLNTYFNTQYLDLIIKPLTRRAGQPHLNADQIKGLKVIMPSIEEQRLFEKRFKKIEGQKNQIECSLIELNTLYSALIQKAFKGELFQEQL